MGWNDRNPELYEVITGLRYEDDQPIGSPAKPVRLPPAMPESCSSCGTTGDICRNPIYTSECAVCEHEVCIECAGEDNSDEGGVSLVCKGCAA